jgi:hypothetical protein
MLDLEIDYWRIKCVVGCILKNYSVVALLVIFCEEKFYAGIILRCCSGNKFEKRVCICFDI